MVATTRHPLEANNVADALPSPDELPVMKIVLAFVPLMTPSSLPGRQKWPPIQVNRNPG